MSRYNNPKLSNKTPTETDISITKYKKIMLSDLCASEKVKIG
jgi:hypothetical protein